MSGFELFEKGGVMMVFITLLSAYVVAAIAYKLYVFFKAGVFSARSASVLQVLQSGRLHEAEAQMKAQRGVIATTLLSGLVAKRETPDASRLESALILQGSQTIKRLESHMRGLEMASSIAPLLGLLGTVIGLIDSFSKLGASGTRVDPSVLAGGIWEALLTTAAGLGVAILAFAAHYFFDAAIERVRFALQQGATFILHAKGEGGASSIEEPGATPMKLVSPKYIRP